MSEISVFLKDNEPYITLQSLLKVTGIVSTGGMVKSYLLESPVKVNGVSENRRGRKLYQGDIVEAENKAFVIKKT